MVFPAPVTIPAGVLARLVTDQRLGEPHITLTPTAVWHDSGQDQMTERLTVLGWLTRAGELEREISASLTVLCRPRVEMYGWLTHEGVTVGVLAARIGKDAVLAVRTPDGMVGLSTIPASRLAERLVAQTPHVAAAHGRPLTVSPAEVRSVNKIGRQLTPAGATIRLPSLDVRRATQLLAQPRSGGGELWVATRDGAGCRHVITDPVRYADLSGGRHLVTTAGGGQVRLSPAGRHQLVAVLDQAHRALLAGHS